MAPKPMAVPVLFVRSTASLAPEAISAGVAGELLALPMTDRPVELRSLALVTAPLAIVVATEPAVVVTSPVSAGKFPAGCVPRIVQAFAADSSSAAPALAVRRPRNRLLVDTSILATLTASGAIPDAPMIATLQPFEP